MSERSTTAIWDVGFFSDPDILALEDQFGRAAGADFARIVLALYQKGGRLRKSDALVILRRSGLENAEQFIDACIERELFYLIDGDLGSKRVDRELLSLQRKRDAWRERQSKSRESRKCHGSVTRDMGVTSKEETEPETEEEPDREEEPEREPEQHLPTPEPEPDPPPAVLEPPDEYLQAAELELLQPGKGAAWEMSSAFMCAGRRPIRRFPEIFISADELAHVFREWEAVGLTSADLEAGCKSAIGRLRTMKTQHKRTDTVSVYNWLIGWIKDEIVQSRTKANWLKNSEAKRGANVN